MNCNQLFRIVIWVTKLLVLIECQCTISIEDPEWNKQWYLQKNRMYRYDMNVMPAWRSCVNGSGVTVGVVDKGVEDHWDLNINRYLDNSRRQRLENPYYDRTRQPSRNRYLDNSRRQRLENPYYARTRQPSRNRYLDNSRRQRLENPYYARTRQPSREDFGHYRNRWTRRYQEILKHGTRVAGIVAAKKNQMGIIGIAFGAQIADIQIASSSVFEHFNAALLRHRDDVIDIYSCSFANFHTGTKTYPLLREQKNALESGTTQGRNGLGSVYVFATGNSGGDDRDVFRDSCAYDRLVTNRYVISVAGIQHDLQKLPNGEACSAMMVTAFTTKAGAENIGKVITTDIGNTTTDHFNQNSAAAPMVSGAVALALSANVTPAFFNCNWILFRQKDSISSHSVTTCNTAESIKNLTYRDIMHLLVKTSRNNLTAQFRTNFFRNAAGIYVSSYFGFGLLDIGKLVERSKTWINVPSRQNCRTRNTPNRRLNRDSIVVQVTQCSVTYIEHVEISLKVNHQHAGQIKWVLVSPYGTKSIILPGRGLDPTTNMDITVLTVQFWGENPNGYWTLEPTAVFGKSLDHGTVESAGLSIHGYACRRFVDDCLPAAEQDQLSPTVRSLPVQVDRTPDVVSSSGTGRSSGECPSPIHLTTSCVEQCSLDSDCSFYKKCCDNGCGHTCEISRTYQGSWTNWSQWSDCTVTCGRGAHRRSRQCYSGYCLGKRFETRRCNNLECQDEVQYGRRSGECPSPSPLTRRCVEQCSYDSDCSYYQKCCNNGCGHTCEMSRTYQPPQTVRPLPEQVCSDSYEGCSYLARNNGCTRRGYSYMYRYCRRTCNFCY